MKVDRQKLYHQGKDFFDLDGNAVMKLDREAAVEVCLEVASRGLLVLRIEGGIWSNRTFEARLDAVWDEADPPIEEKEADENNRAAANFILSCPSDYDAFIITAFPFNSYSSTVNRALPA